MDSRTNLDYALFQLTPTRTRCDLVVCAGAASEKLASGLLDPFLSHLRYAKDQISKGGYSITLRSAAAWFTKGTLERFVRFVSTPEVLERFVTLEKEIVQIEKSIQSNELQNNDTLEGNTSVSEGKSGQTFSSRDAPDGSDDAEAVPEENSKVRLQRILETRKAVLCKEQGMAFARALVAGFELDYIDNLICFADAFGAHRMREACINFMNLCKAKEEDRHWKDEIAAMQALSRPDFPYLATSGIVLASDDHGPSHLTGIQDGGSLSGNSNNSGDVSVADPNTDGRLPPLATSVSHDGRPHVPMSWPNHLPQYMKNLQGPFFPQMHPHPGYMLPNMQIPPSYYPGNGKNWPPTAEDYGVLLGRESDAPAQKRSVKNKKKQSRRKASEDAETDESTDVSDSNSGSESDGNEQSRQTHSVSGKPNSKKPGKKSSRKVVIRNINYITSERDGGRSYNSDDNSFSEVDGESIKHQVKKAVGSVHGHHGKKRETRNQFGKDELKNAFDEDENTTQGTSQLNRDGRNENWNAFQNLLMESGESASMVSDHHANLQEEHFSSQSMKGKPNKSAIIDDPLLRNGKDGGSEFPSARNEFDDGQLVRLLVKKRDGAYDDLLIPRNSEESGGFNRAPASDYSSLTSTRKMQKEKDWLAENQSPGAVYQHGSVDPRMVEADFGLSFVEERNKKEILADDSFMIEGRQTAEHHSDYPLAMDIEIGPDPVIAENPQPDQSQSNLFEPDDLYMVLDRDATDHAMALWTPELDYANDSAVEKIGKHVSDEAMECSENNPPSNITMDETQAGSDKKMNKGVRSKVVSGVPGKGKPDIMARNRKPVPGSRATVPKSKAQTEEERRRRMEELLIQRQKRIAERSSYRDLTQVASKDSTVAKNQPEPILRNSTVGSLATARATVKASPARPAPAQRVKTVTKTKEPSKAMPQKTTIAENRKPTSKMVESAKRKNSSKNSDGPALSDSVSQGKKGNAKAVKVPVLAAPTAEQTARPVQANNDFKTNDDFKDIPERPTNPIRTSEEKPSSKNETTAEQSYIPLPTTKEDSAEIIPTRHDMVARVDLSHKHDDRIDEDSPNELTMHPVPSLDSDGVSSIRAEEEPSGIEEVTLPHAPQLQMYTPPPPTSEITPEPVVHSRKKWNSDDIQPKPAKGLRKLLLFGRKKISYA